MLKYSFFLIIILIFSCKKEQAEINIKDYKKPSYDLRVSDLWLDCSKIYQSLPSNLYNNVSVIADFNTDGFDDVLMAFTNYTETRYPLKIYLNDGTNSHFIVNSDLIQNNIGVKNARKGIVGDFNGDSKPDVIFAESGVDAPPFSGTEQSILVSTPNGYEYKFLSDIVWFGHGVCSSDFDNDGDLDVYFTSPSEKLCLLVNNGDGTFINHPEKLKFPSYGVATCEMRDINKDGFTDLIIGGHNFSSDPNNLPARILFGNGRDFDNERSIQIPGVQGWDIIIDFNFADINNDGYEEIIANRTGDPSIEFYKGFRIQILKTNDYKNYLDVTDDMMKDFYSSDISWIVWLRTEDIDKNGKLDIFDSDRGHNNSGITIRWEQDNYGSFRRQ